MIFLNATDIILCQQAVQEVDIKTKQVRIEVLLHLPCHLLNQYGLIPASIKDHSDGRMTLSILIEIKHWSGRKPVTLLNGETAQPRPWDSAPSSLQLALAHGHRWLAMLESGELKPWWNLPLAKVWTTAKSDGW